MFLRIEQGRGIVQMGPSKHHLQFKRNVYDDTAIVVPAGTWHNLTNTGSFYRLSKILAVTAAVFCGQRIGFRSMDGAEWMVGRSID